MSGTLGRPTYKLIPVSSASFASNRSWKSAPTADFRASILAYREPRLCEMTLFEIVGCARATHLCRDPTGVDGVAQHFGPAPRDCESECGHVQLALAVGTIGIPSTFISIDIV